MNTPPPQAAAEPDPYEQENGPDEITKFRAELRRLWVRAGAPSPQEMAERTGLPAARLSTALTHPGLPEFHEVEALLRATGEHAAIPAWRRLWRRLDNEKQHARRAVPKEEDTANSAMVLSGVAQGSLPDVVPTSYIERDAEVQAMWFNLVATSAFTYPEPLRAAMNASTALELNQALDQLRQAAGLSLREVADRCGHKVSKSSVHRLAKQDWLAREETIEHVVRACQVGDYETRLWLLTATRLRHGTPPPVLLRHPEEPAPAAPAKPAASPEKETPAQRQVVRMLLWLLAKLSRGWQAGVLSVGAALVSGLLGGWVLLTSAQQVNTPLAILVIMGSLGGLLSLLRLAVRQRRAERLVEENPIAEVTLLRDAFARELHKHRLEQQLLVAARQQEQFEIPAYWGQSHLTVPPGRSTAA
ncbi:helix-turn-helix domain-containing protein [Saccharopolyspora shandongensis]|uniref:helix-turn-helix domain-containing protein n=1 Tax=Saccharopolyspora shandongensis TaxID=418495 RepID=UPI0033FA518A